MSIPRCGTSKFSVFWLIAGILLAPRSEGADMVVAASPSRGLVNQPIQVQLSTSSNSGEIWYTTDTREPHNGFDGKTTQGERYTQPIPLTSSTVVKMRAFGASGPLGPTTTHSYLFLSSVQLQATNPPGFPLLWGLRKSDYAMDPRVLTNASYASEVTNQWLGLPTVSVSAPLEDVFGTNGIYPNSDQNGTHWERAASLEFLPHASWGEGAQINAGLQILGETSRDTSNPKHSFRLSFKSRYGPSRLEFPVFTNSMVHRFDTLDVLAGSFDCVTMNFQDIDLNGPSYARDAWLKNAQLDMGQPGIHTRFVHLYLNGLYWGLYHLGERPDAGYADEYLGGKKSDFDVLKHAGTAELEVVDGDRSAWDAMVAIAARGLENASNYAAIQGYLDLPAFADYLIANMHSGNGDWPQKNWYAVRKRAPGEPFRFFCWDGDAVLGLVSTNINKTTFATTNTPAYLYDRLTDNSEFLQLFGDRIQSLVFGGGALSVTANQDRLNRIAEEISEGIILESARWGDAYFKRPGRSLFLPNEHWRPEIQRMLNQVIPNRHRVSLRHFQSAGLYPLVSPPELSPAPGWVAPLELITVHDSATQTGAVVLITTNGIDPRMEGGLQHPDAFSPQQSLAISRDTTIKARVKKGTEWSALVIGRYAPIDRPLVELIRSPNTTEPLSLRFQALANVGYLVESCSMLTRQEWTLLQSYVPSATQRTITLPVSPKSSGDAFFRVRIFGGPE